MAHTSSNLAVHMIFSTNARQPVIESAFRADLFAYLGGIVREMQDAALIVNGTADHVHLLLRIRPAQWVAEVARVVNKLVEVGARKVESAFCLANGIRGIQRERIEYSRRNEVHRRAGKAS